MRINLLNKIILGLFVFASCTTIKNVDQEKIGKVITGNELLDSIKANDLKPEWFKIRGNAVISLSDEDAQEVDINIKSKVDSLVWVNISKFKKKIFRTLISKDSVKMTLEYPDKKFYAGSFQHLNNITDLSLSYEIIENLIIGGSYLNHLNQKVKIQAINNEYLITTRSKRKAKKNLTYIYQSWWNPITFKCNRVNILFPDNDSEINISYDNWKNYNIYKIPSNIELLIKNKQVDYLIKLELKNIKLNQPQKFSFNMKFNDYSPLAEDE